VDRQVDRLCAPKLLRLLGSSLADHGKACSGLLEPVPRMVQLHRVGSAEHATVVAQEDQHRRLISPELPESHLRAFRVLDDDVLELRAMTRRAGCLGVLGGLQHFVESYSRGDYVAALARTREATLPEEEALRGAGSGHA